MGHLARIFFFFQFNNADLTHLPLTSVYLCNIRALFFIWYIPFVMWNVVKPAVVWNEQCSPPGPEDFVLAWKECEHRISGINISKFIYIVFCLCPRTWVSFRYPNNIYVIQIEKRRNNNKTTVIKRKQTSIKQKPSKKEISCLSLQK